MTRCNLLVKWVTEVHPQVLSILDIAKTEVLLLHDAKRLTDLQREG